VYRARGLAMADPGPLPTGTTCTIGD
jgi:hypothetical protein